MRRLIAFPCEGETLLGTLDEASGDTGLLIVSGGNEVRAGAHRGMAHLAARLASQGIPVFRFDRRGIGDSSGENGGFAQSGPDIAAAAACFRQEAGLASLVALGNCDGATALAMFGRAAGVDALIFTNPWLADRNEDGLPPGPAIRARYLDRLRNPASWRQLPSLPKLLKGLRAIARPTPQPARAALFAAPPLPTTVILAERDATAIAYRSAVGGPAATIATASHSFADSGDELEAAVLAAVRRYSAA